MIEATGSYFIVYDSLDEHLEVVLVKPLKTRWIAETDEKPITSMQRSSFSSCGLI